MAIGEISDRPLIGISCFITNLLLMTAISVLVKHLAGSYSLNQILLVRFLAAFSFFSVLLLPRFGLSGLKTHRPLDHAIRSLSGVGSLFLFFYAVTTIPIADATAISFSAPIFITVFAIYFLGEKIGRYRWLAVFIGFIGVLIIAQPSADTTELGTWAALGSAIGGAMVSVWIRRLSASEKSVTIGFYYNLTGSMICLLWIYSTGWLEIEKTDLIVFTIFAICCGAQQWFLTISFRYAEASVLAPFDYLAMVFAAIAGVIFWHEVPTVSSVLGAVVIASSGLFIFLRQRHKGGEPIEKLRRA